MIGHVLPGDVIAVRTPDTTWWDRWSSRLIRLGAALRDEDNLVNHVAVVHHTDAAGTTWAIEGRPGGVGWTDVAGYDNPYFLSNAGLAKTDEQRAQICKAAEGMLGVRYDWAAIGMDALEAVGLDGLWRSHVYGDKPPAQVVCSALAAYLYWKLGLPCPNKPWRTTTPADWAELILAKGWSA